MAQPTPEDANGVKIPDGDAGENGYVVAASGKRKRDSDNGDRAEDGGDEMDVDSKVEQPSEDDSKTPEPEEDTTKNKELVKAFVEVLRRYDCILPGATPAFLFSLILCSAIMEFPHF